MTIEQGALEPGTPIIAQDEETADGQPGARVPKYYRLKRHLLELTRTQSPGSPVPPERTLARDFDTSRTTVRQAVAELIVEGRLEHVQGKGTFVAKPKVVQALQLTSYTEDMRAKGLEPASRLLEVGYIGAGDDLAHRLRVKPGTRVLRIVRLRMADDEPMALETAYLSTKRFPGLRRHLAKYASLYTALGAEYGVYLAEADETIETALATPREAALLGTETGRPMLLLSRHSKDDKGEPVEWARSVYRGDRYKLLARLTRPADAPGRAPTGRPRDN